MNDLELGQILGALFLAVIVVTALVSSGSHGWGKTFKQGAVWAVIFVATVVVAGLWQDIQGSGKQVQVLTSGNGTIEVPRSRDGHYYLTLEVNGQPVDFVVDTGATNIVLTTEDAVKIGLPLDELRFFGRANTANGEVRTAPVSLKNIRIADVVDTNVRAYVNEGEMFQSLLGMSYLQRWSHIEIRDNALVLTR